MEDLVKRIQHLSTLDSHVADYILHSQWDGVEHSDSDGETFYTPEFEIRVYKFIIRELDDKGILFHDAAEMCTEGGYKNVLQLLISFFNKDNLLTFIQNLPMTVRDTLSQIIFSDELNDEDVLESFIYSLSLDLPTYSNISLLNYYSDTFYSDHQFVTYMQSVFELIHSDNKIKDVSIISQDSIERYIRYVQQHQEHVRYIVSLILSKSDLVFDKTLLNTLLDQHDNDLLSENCVGVLANDKDLFKDSSYHVYSSHPAIDLYYSHKVNSPHHLEYYTVRQRVFDLDEYIVLWMADLFSSEFSLLDYKQRIETYTNAFPILRNKEDVIKRLLDVINIIPPIRK